MSGQDAQDDLQRRSEELFDALAQSQAHSAEIQVRIEQLRFEAAVRNGQVADQGRYMQEMLARLRARNALAEPSQPHEIAPEVRANLTWQPDQRVLEGAPLKLRRVNEKSKFPLKATFGELINEFWPKVSKQLTLEQRATLKPKVLFDRLALDRGFDTRTLWRAWDTFVLPEQRKELPMPLPSDWARQPPNADRFEVHRIGPAWRVLSFEPYAAQLMGLEPSLMVGRMAEEGGLKCELLSIDLASLSRLLFAEDEIALVARVTGPARSLLVLATMERLGADGNWRTMWQVLHERELDSAIEFVQRHGHRPTPAKKDCRVSKPDCRDSSAPETNYCRDSARDPARAQAGGRVTARIAAGRRVA